MFMITENDKKKIKDGWARGLTRASFGGGKGTCQLSGSRQGFVVLYVHEDKNSFALNRKDSATPYLFSVNAYRLLKKELDTEFPGATALKESYLKKPPTKLNTVQIKRILREGNVDN